MAHWVYKCNALRREYQSASGDWDEVFAKTKSIEWGSTAWTPELKKTRSGDKVLAYQTDRNELVGMVRVVRKDQHRGYTSIVVRPMEELRAKVRPLKKASRRIAKIPALQQGPVHTLYEISASDFWHLVEASRAGNITSLNTALADLGGAESGGGFGSLQENRRVEEAAIRFVRDYFERYGWSVRDVSKTRCHFDLDCARGANKLHIEVKGTRGAAQQFIMTYAEAQTWRRDTYFVVAVVTSALRAPRLFQFRGPPSIAEVEMKPIAFMCVKRK